MKSECIKTYLFNKKYEIYNQSCCSNTNKRTMYIELLNKCNAKCAFCYQNRQVTQEISLDKLKINIDELINKKIIDKITLTGGEPLLYSNLKDLLLLLDSYNDLNFYALTTNGKLLPEKIDTLEKSGIKYINISRHHYEDNINNSIFKTKTISTETIKDIVKNSNKTFRFNATITNELNSTDDILKYIEMAKYCGIKNILLRKNYHNESTDILTGVVSLFKNITKEKISNKCHCMVTSVDDINIEFRIVNVSKELEIENNHKFIRNIIYTSNNILQGGWSNKSIIIN